MSGLKISELAERAGVNVSTVRYYERTGLVPDPDRSHAGYRLYGPVNGSLPVPSDATPISHAALRP